MTNHPHRGGRSKSVPVPITRELAARILAWIDQGLTPGKGSAQPGRCCIEAVVCNLTEGRHDDDPVCVSPSLRSLKIRLNDSKWSSDQARAAGLRRLGLAQLGSAGFLDESEFIKRLCDLVLRNVVPGALRIAASIHPKDEHKKALIEAAGRCEQHPSEKTARKAEDAAAYAAAADAAAYAVKKNDARDRSLATFAEDVVQILSGMNAPGCQWLDLTVKAPLF